MSASFIAVLLLWFLCVAEFNEISQPVSLQTLTLGKSATIECYIKSLIDKRVWYKLSTDRALQLVAILDIKYKRSEISDEFKQSFSVKFDNYSSHLSISRASKEDVGTYFCGVVYLNYIQFGSGTTLTVKGEINPLELNQTNVALIVSNSIFGIVILLLLWIICRIWRKDSPEAPDRSSDNEQQTQDTDMYSAVAYSAVSRPHRSLNSRPPTVKYSEDSVVYSDIRK